MDSPGSTKPARQEYIFVGKTDLRPSKQCFLSGVTTHIITDGSVRG